MASIIKGLVFGLELVPFGIQRLELVPIERNRYKLRSQNGSTKASILNFLDVSRF